MCRVRILITRPRRIQQNRLFKYNSSSSGRECSSGVLERSQHFIAEDIRASRQVPFLEILTQKLTTPGHHPQHITHTITIAFL
jgi:hypothetical protein